MGTVIYNGLMKKNMRAISLKIKDMVLANLSGRMAENMKEIGTKANNMVLDYIEMLRVARKGGSGKMESGYNGYNE
jgi:hypothetical protein